MDNGILVVECDPPTRHLLHVMFRDLGNVTLVCSRAAAEKSMADDDFDVVVTDFNLIRFSYDWIDELVAKGLPTVVITARSAGDELSRINESAHVFGRPFNPNTVRECVASLLGR